MSQLTFHFLGDWSIFLTLPPKVVYSDPSAVTTLSPCLMLLKHKVCSEWSCLFTICVSPLEGSLGQGPHLPCSLPDSACRRCSVKYVFDDAMAFRFLLRLTHPQLASRSTKLLQSREKIVTGGRPGVAVSLWRYVTAHLFSFVLLLSFKKLKISTAQRDMSKRGTLKE